MTVDETVPYGIEIERLPGYDGPNYQIRRRDNGRLLLSCGWISMGTGQPFAFGGDTATEGAENPAAEFGGRVRVESRGEGEDGIYSGARLNLQG